MKRLLIALALLAVPVLASAQAPASYELRIYTPGAAAPMQRSPFPVSEVVCNLAPPASGSTINPTMAVWDDLANAGRACVWTPNASPTGVLVALPAGTYEGTVVAIDAAGVGVESNRAPFSKQPIQPARTGLRFTRAGN